jgi:hypothetical protein
MTFRLPQHFRVAAPALALLAISVPLYFANAQPPADPTTDISGSWLFKLSRTAPMPAQLLTLGTFTKDGSFVGTAQGDGLCCPASGPAHGAWVKTGANEFTTTFVTIWHQADGSLFGVLTVTLTLTVDKKSDQVSGQLTGEVVGPGGNVIFPVQGSLTGQRIRVQ